MDIAGFASDPDTSGAAGGGQNELDMSEYEYLLKNDPVSRLKYMFDYEAWFRFMPVDVGLRAYSAVKGGVSGGKLGAKTSIAHNGEWSDDYVYGEEEVFKYRANKGEKRPILDEAGEAELLYGQRPLQQVYERLHDGVHGLRRIQKVSLWRPKG